MYAIYPHADTQQKSHTEPSALTESELKLNFDYKIKQQTISVPASTQWLQFQWHQ